MYRCAQTQILLLHTYKQVHRHRNSGAGRLDGGPGYIKTVFVQRSSKLIWMWFPFFYDVYFVYRFVTWWKRQQTSTSTGSKKKKKGEFINRNHLKKTKRSICFCCSVTCAVAYSTRWDGRPLGERRAVLLAEVCAHETRGELWCFSDPRLSHPSSARCRRSWASESRHSQFCRGEKNKKRVSKTDGGEWNLNRKLKGMWTWRHYLENINTDVLAHCFHVVLWLQGDLQNFGAVDDLLVAGRRHRFAGDAVDLIKGVGLEDALIGRTDEDLQTKWVLASVAM